MNVFYFLLIEGLVAVITAFYMVKIGVLFPTVQFPWNMVIGAFLLLFTLSIPVIIIFQYLKDGVCSTKEVRNNIDKALAYKLQKSCDVTFQDMIENGLPLRIIATDLNSKQIKLFSEATPNIVVADAVAASLAIPVVFQAARVPSSGRSFSHYFDGGLVSNNPDWAFDLTLPFNPNANILSFGIDDPDTSNLTWWERLKNAFKRLFFENTIIHRLTSLEKLKNAFDAALFGSTVIHRWTDQKNLIKLKLTDKGEKGIGLLDFDIEKQNLFNILSNVEKACDNELKVAFENPLALLHEGVTKQIGGILKKNNMEAFPHIFMLWVDQAANTDGNALPTHVRNLCRPETGQEDMIFPRRGTVFNDALDVPVLVEEKNRISNGLLGNRNAKKIKESGHFYSRLTLEKASAILVLPIKYIYKDTLQTRGFLLLEFHCGESLAVLKNLKTQPVLLNDLSHMVCLACSWLCAYEVGWPIQDKQLNECWEESRWQITNLGELKFKADKNDQHQPPDREFATLVNSLVKNQEALAEKYREDSI